MFSKVIQVDAHLGQKPMQTSWTNMLEVRFYDEVKALIEVHVKWLC
jgi:hypothetical protein